MTRGGATKDTDDQAMRKCIATGEVCPKDRLIRFVASPDGVVVPDILGKLPGRGIWVLSDRAVLERAVAKNLFSRAAKQKLSVPASLPRDVETMLARRVVDLISLARKSGVAVAGYEKVKAWLSMDEADVLIQAEDGSTRGKSKLSTPQWGSYIGWLTADELGLAFGREYVIHAALTSGGLTTRVVEEAQRLKGVRGYDGARKGTGKEKTAI